MRLRDLGTIVALLALTSTAPRDAGAALPRVTRGTLLARTGSPGAPGGLQEVPAVRTDVRIRIAGLVARAEVAQTFRNPTARWLEAVYVFPLPDGAAVDALRMRIGERLVEGEIRERAEARQAYQAAQAAGRKASLVEQERPNVFTTSVANVGPGEAVEVRIEYQEIVRYDQGDFRLRFPTVVGPRYIPGTAGIDGVPGTGWGVNTPEVPDAARITPPVRHPAEGPAAPVALTVDLDAGIPLRRVGSPSHPVTTTPASATRHTVTLADGAVPADRDFELVWTPDVGAEPAAAVFTEWHDHERYALVMVLPPATAAGAARLPRETIFVIDTSGSMAGASIQQARLALDEALGALAPSDRFNVIRFSSTTRALFPASAPAGPAEVAHARRFVAGLRAQGGTEMLPALQAALEGDRAGGLLRQVVFVTDGLVGNEDQLFGYIHRALDRSRLFTVGIGPAPNAHFMTRAAQFGRGTYTYIGSPAEVAEKMGALFRKLEHPVLGDVGVSFGRPDVEAWPQRVPDLYVGEPVVLVARLGADPAAELRVAGRRGEAGWGAALRLDAGTDHAGIHKLWGRKKIAALMDRLREGGDPAEVRQAVLTVALAHHLVSAYTSLVAVDVAATRPDGAPGGTATVPVALPAGLVHEQIFGPLPQGATPAPLYLALGLACLALSLAVRRWALPRGGR
jgi:Ca-activated chloride channel family protein